MAVKKVLSVRYSEEHGYSKNSEIKKTTNAKKYAIN